MDHWKPDGAKVRRTLTSHHGRNPLVSKNKKLPPAPAAVPEPESTQSDTITTDSDAPEAEDAQIDDTDGSNTGSSSRTSSPQPTRQDPPMKQNSLFSLHKPDAVENNPEHGGNNDEDDLPLAPMSPRPQSASLQDYAYPSTPQPPGHAGGFSTVYLVK